MYSKHTKHEAETYEELLDFDKAGAAFRAPVAFPVFNLRAIVSLSTYTARHRSATVSMASGCCLAAGRAVKHVAQACHVTILLFRSRDRFIISITCQ